MKKLLPLCLGAMLCLFSTSGFFAQAPSITAQVGFPVNVKHSVQVAYGNSKYVLLGGYNNNAALNSLYSSATATAWSLTNTTNLITTQLNNIAFGAGLFVVAGNGGVIQTSTDGITWTTRTSGTSSDLYKIYFINSRFFAAGTNRTLLTSPDGIPWTTIGFNAGNPADYFMSVTYGNGAYVLSARNNSGNYASIYRSTTAADNSWTYSTNSIGLGATVNRIQFLNNKFFAFLANNNMYNSTDGITWTNFTSSVVLTNPNSTTTAWNSSHQIFNGVWDGTNYSFYGSSAFYSGYGSTFTSTDGVNLTLLTKTAYIVPQESNYINGMWLVCGNEGIVSSSDGLTYKHPGSSFREMVKTATKYVAVGLVGPDAQIYNSTDFSSWTDRTLANTKELLTVAYDGTNVLAGGTAGVLRSTNNGDSWAPVYTNNAEVFCGMAYGNGRFVAAGSNNGAGFIRYSTDAGQTWTTASSADNYYIKVKYINNTFFAFGYDNATYESVIMHSPDGISWTNVTPNLGFEVLYYKDVAFDGSSYYFFGIESLAYVPVQFFSVSTPTPGISSSYAGKATIANAPAGAVLAGGWDEGVLDYVAGKFTGAIADVFTGQDYIITSTDGASWTAIPQYSFSSITSSHISGTTVYMIGRGNAFFTVDYGTTLPVSLLQFNGRLVNGKTQLAWTASGQGTKEFNVQHSVNGAVWHIIGTVAASGNSAQIASYNFTHTTPARGENFYRLLLQHDNEEKTESKVVRLTANAGRQIVASYPNPANDRFVIQTATNGQGLVVLYNAAGQAVKTISIIGNVHSISLAGMAKGLYRAAVNQGGQQENVSFIKN